MSNKVLAFDEAVRQRFSSRAFLPTPLTEAQIRDVLQDAQHSPSNCNTQPWNVHIASGATKDALQKMMIENDTAGNVTPDFSFSYDDFHGDYYERSQRQAKDYYDALGIARDDKEKYCFHPLLSLANEKIFHKLRDCKRSRQTRRFYSDKINRVGIFGIFLYNKIPFPFKLRAVSGVIDFKVADFEARKKPVYSFRKTFGGTAVFIEVVFFFYRRRRGTDEHFSAD